jgi:hypothetical protein
MTYYEVATNAHGRIDLCTGRLQPRWHRAVHTGNPYVATFAAKRTSPPRTLQLGRGGKYY